MSLAAHVIDTLHPGQRCVTVEFIVVLFFEFHHSLVNLSISFLPLNSVSNILTDVTPNYRLPQFITGRRQRVLFSVKPMLIDVHELQDFEGQYCNIQSRSSATYDV